MNKCLRCGAPADAPIPMSIKGTMMELPACRPCADEALAGYRVLQADAARLLERGMHQKMVNRIMTERVLRGEYG